MKKILKKHAPFTASPDNSAAQNHLGQSPSHASTIPFFSNIPEPALSSLMEKTKTLNYVKKAEFGLEHSKNNAFFVVFLGNVTVLSPYDGNHNSKSAMLQVQEPRLGFGKAMLITEEVSSYYDISLEKVLYGFIPKNDFFRWMSTYSDIKFTLLSVFDQQ